MSLAWGRETGSKGVSNMKKYLTDIHKDINESIIIEKFLQNKHKSLFLIKKYKDIIENEEQKEDLFQVPLDCYYFGKNIIKIKNSEIARFLKNYQIKGWSLHPVAQNRWIHLPDKVIASRFEEVLHCFCKKYCLCTDKKQLSRVIYFFELCFVLTLAKKYQMSVKKIYSSKLISKKRYLLLYNEKNIIYEKVFCKKTFYQYFVI